MIERDAVIQRENQTEKEILNHIALYGLKDAVRYVRYLLQYPFMVPDYETQRTYREFVARHFNEI